MQPLLQAGQRGGTGDKQADEVCRPGWLGGEQLEGWVEGQTDRWTDGEWVGGRMEV